MVGKGTFGRLAIQTTIVRIVGVFAGLATAALTARFLGPSGRGEFFFVTTLAALVVQFGNLGLHSSNTYLSAQDGGLVGKLVANSLWVSIGVGSLGTLVLIASLELVGWMPHLPAPVYWFALVLAPPALLFNLASSIFPGINRFDYFNLGQLASSLFGLVLIVLAGALALDVAGFLGASATAAVLSALVVMRLHHRVALLRIAFDTQVFVRGFRFAVKAYVVAFLAFLVLRSNVFLLQNYVGSEEVGYFSIATQIAEALGIFPASVALVLFPQLVRDSHGRWESAVKTMLVTGIAMAVACAIIGLLAEPLITFVFGTAFRDAAPILLAMLPAAFFLGMISILAQYLAALGIPKELLGIWAVGLAIVISIGIVLIPRYDGIGAAAALSSTYGLVFVMVAVFGYFLARRHETTKSLS
jgi:O-antigen/teichoic acid export membrane protein